jgi:hypothetical protein
MTSRQRELVDKYLSAIDKSSDIAINEGEEVYMVDAEYVKALIIDLMREYERINTYPKVDFWGEPIS